MTEKYADIKKNKKENPKDNTKQIIKTKTSCIKIGFQSHKEDKQSSLLWDSGGVSAEEADRS